MTDIDYRTGNRSPSQGSLQDTVGDIKNKASDALSATSDMARDKLDELGSSAREAAAQATDKIREQADKQQRAGAEYAGRFAENLRNAAHAFDQDTPLAARLIETAADYVDDAAGKMRDGSLNDLMGSLSSFARRQPAAFLGLSVLAGFAAVRFLKASGNSPSGRSTDGSTSNYAATDHTGGAGMSGTGRRA